MLVGFGGYVATPGYLAARRRKVPIVVHEANPRPGLANRIGARLTDRVFTGQPGVKLPHARYIGIPIRRQIAGLDRLALSDEARAHFGLRPDLPVLLVTGGSQGARSINQAVLGAARRAARGRHPGAAHRRPARRPTSGCPPGEVPYVVLPYLDRMDLGYAAADFALCRAGAMTCAELTAVGLPAAYVPLPHGNGEQRLNALPIEQAGGGLIVADADLTPEWIQQTLLPILLDAELVAAMSKAAADSGNRDADRQLADEVLDRPPAAAAGAGRRASRRWPTRDEEEQGMGLVTPVDAVPVSELGRVHFVGIGGAGMSGIARIMLARGDRRVRQRLRGLGRSWTSWPRSAPRSRRARGGATWATRDTLVVSSAIRPDNPELTEARRRGLRVLHRAAALASRDAGPPGHRGGRHARQDHHHLHDHHGAAQQRRRSRRT